jgi:molybdate transport system permease protein
VNASPLILSLLVAGLSTLLVFVTGLPLARWLSRHRGTPARLVDALVTAPLVLPPVVCGYYLLALFAPHGPLGVILRKLFGVSIIFHWTGAVLASSVVAFPLLVRTAQAALESVPRGYMEAALTCGSKPWRAFLTVQLPLALPGVAAGIVLAFARGLGEFGATVIVAGNIPGKTQTLPLAIYQAIVSGNVAAANSMVLIMTAFAVVLLFLADRFQRRAIGRERSSLLP